MRLTRSVAIALWAWAIVGADVAEPQQGAASQYDVLISGGRLYDGTGNPWFYADVALKDGRIAAVGHLDSTIARLKVDAHGKVVVPGFIDLHSHADDEDPRGGLRDPNAKRRAAPNLVMQGVTTVVVNQDGRSPLPIREQQSALMTGGFGPNAILLVGHGSVRERVMGRDYKRLARPDEIGRMRTLVREAMQDGAWGLSSGLEYEPGRWSNTEELVQLAKEVAPYHGIYISHERSEGSDPMWFWPSQDPAGPATLLDAVRETIEIGERTGVTAIASHIKTKGANYWGSSAAAIQLIQRARARGVDVWADQYPYNTSGTDGNTVLLPPWAISAGVDVPGDPSTKSDFAANLRRTMADGALSVQLRRDIAHEIARRGGAENVVVFEYPDSAAIGKSVAQLAAARGVSDVDMAIQLQLEGFKDRPGGGRLRGFSMSERDVEAFAAQPWLATSSDAGIALPEDGPDVHARYYGTFPRKIRHYALERGVISVEQAIRSMTTLPAQILGLQDRGEIRKGLAADVVVLDLDKIRDAATFFNPHLYAEGVDYVWVGGTAVVERGVPTWKLPGRVLRRDESRR